MFLGGSVGGRVLRNLWGRFAGARQIASMGMASGVGEVEVIYFRGKIFIFLLGRVSLSVWPLQVRSVLAGGPLCCEVDVVHTDTR